MAPAKTKVSRKKVAKKRAAAKKPPARKKIPAKKKAPTKKKVAKKKVAAARQPRANRVKLSSRARRPASKLKLTNGDLEQMKKKLREISFPAEIRTVFDAAQRGDRKGFVAAIRGLEPRRLEQLVGALDWSDELGLVALGKLEKIGKGYHEAIDSILKQKIPPAKIMLKCCCEPDIFPELCEMVKCLCRWCCCCGCCDWDEICLHRCRCCCCVLVYPGPTKFTPYWGCALEFTTDFKVKKIDHKIQIDLNSTRYYTKTQVNDLLSAKAERLVDLADVDAGAALDGQVLIAVEDSGAITWYSMPVDDLVNLLTDGAIPWAKLDPSTIPAAGAHAAEHQPGGSDVLDVAGLSGVLADPQTPASHAITAHTGTLNHSALGGVGATDHHSNANDPTTAQKAALDGANGPDAGNAFATMADVGSTAQADIINGSIPYDGNGTYTAGTGLTKDVSAEIPAGFTLTAVYATGYKAHQMTGARQDEPPLNLEPKVSGTDITVRVWDATGDEYGGANWSSMRAHIDYTLLVKK